MVWDTPRAKQPCIRCHKNLAGHVRLIQRGWYVAHPFVTKDDKNKPTKGKK